MYNETVKLVNGVEVPRLALGTWLIDDDKAADAVRAAIKLGYRHIDTAQAYGNEKGVGEGVRASGVDRKEIFITSKVAAEHKTYEEAAAGLRSTSLIIAISKETEKHGEPWRMPIRPAGLELSESQTS